MVHRQVSRLEVDVAPLEGGDLARPQARLDSDDDRHSEPSARGIDQGVGLFGGQGPALVLGLAGPLCQSDRVTRNEAVSARGGKDLGQRDACVADSV